MPVRDYVHTAIRWLCDQQAPARPGSFAHASRAAVADELEQLAELGERARSVELVVELVYPSATGAMVLRMTLAELAARATTTSEAERSHFPAVMTLPHPVAGDGRYRVTARTVDPAAAGLYAGESVRVDQPSMPIPPSLRRVK